MKLILSFLFSIFVTVSLRATEFNLHEIKCNQKATSLYQNEKWDEGVQLISDCLVENPKSALLHYQLAHFFLSAQKMDQALSSFKTAAEYDKDGEISFASWFNIGLIHHKSKKTPEALAAYQKALSFRPDSIEAKTNIELLTRDQDGQGSGENSDQKDQNGEGKNSEKNKNENQKNDQKDNDSDQSQKDKESDDQQKKNQQPPKINRGQAPKPKFDSKELSQSDVNKILGELKQQEQKIRAEYNRQGKKEKTNGKDW